MANALEAASLVMIPSGYENGTLGSLKPTDGTGDFTFSRGSDISATRVNEDGYIEKGYENLLLQSNSFDTTWTSFVAGVTSSQAGYDGSNDAWLLSKSDASGQIRQNVTSSGVATFSVYAKANGSDYAQMVSGSDYQFFNLSLGTLGAGSGISGSIEAVGTNGWYKISMSFNSSITSVRLYPAEDNNTSATSGSIYIQDAMLNQGLVAYPYVETTTAPVAGGILEDMPRLDYSNGSCPSLLLEPSRTNLITQSEYLNGISGLAKIGTSFDTNATTSPEGLDNASLLKEDSSNGSHFAYTDFALTNGSTYTISIYAKKNGTNRNLKFGDGGVGWSSGFNGQFNLTAGTATGGTIEPMGNGWYRCSVTGTTNATSSRLIIYSTLNASTSYQGDGTSGVYLYGFQLEQASYPTSYIPTYGVSQTRLKDNFDSSADFTNFFGNNQGTIYIETNKRLFGNVSGNESFIGFKDGSKFWRIIGSQNLIFTQSVNWGDTLLLYPAQTNPTKYLFKWDGSNISFYVDGSLIDSTTQTATFNPNEFGRSGAGVSMDSQELLNQFTLFPTALSDDKCIELTTI